jgi:hypothetical protein
LYRPRVQKLALVVALVSSLVSISEARADDAAMSRFHYDQATRHYEAGRFDRAVQEFFLAQRASPNPRTVYNIGLCFLRLSRHEDAFFFLGEYLGLEDDADGADARRTFARDALADLSRRVAQVSVTSDPPGAEIFVDQREHGTWGRTPRTLALPAGEHRVWVELPGHRRAESTIVAALGQEVRVALSPERIVGRVRVTSSVPATVRAFDASGQRVGEGTTPIEIVAAPGRVELEVEAEGHRPSRRFVEVVADETQQLPILLEALPPPTGDLTVTANVPRAVVSLDGEPLGIAPFVLPELGVGRHELAVDAPDRLGWRGEIEVRPNERTWLTVELSEPPRGRSPWTWVLGGVGVTAAGGATGFGILARQRSNDFRSRWNRPGGEDVTDLRSEARRFARTTDALAGVALVSLIGAVVLYFLSPEDEDDIQSTAVFTTRPR